jgi:hypothetical protein
MNGHHVKNGGTIVEVAVKVVVVAQQPSLHCEHTALVVVVNAYIQRSAVYTVCAIYSISTNNW